jgi:S1-C subfamily serine protease
VGELVLAVGNPFGVGQTVSSGIVSGLARSGAQIGNARGYFIQTDAAINPGNSGGALVDINGDLIGINTSILSRSGGSNGIGFAIPSNLVAQFIEQARAGKQRFERPWAGVTAQAVDQGLAEGLGMTLPEGIILTELHPESPFRSAGLASGDVIVGVDGAPVTSAPEMMYRMGVQGIGGEVVLDVLRNGAMNRVSVRLIAPPDSPAREVIAFPDRSAFAGLALSNINPAVQSESRVPISANRGVVVLEAQGLAARVGLRPGDVLRAVNGRQIEQTRDVPDAFGRAGRSFALELERNGRRTLLRFRL